MNFWYNPMNTFIMFSNAHIAVLLIVSMLIIIFIYYKSALIPYRKPLRIIFGITLLTSHVLLTIWYITTGNWSVKSALPLELCSISAIAVGITSLTTNNRMMALLYFFQCVIVLPGRRPDREFRRKPA